MIQDRDLSLPFLREVARVGSLPDKLPRPLLGGYLIAQLQHVLDRVILGRIYLLLDDFAFISR